MHSRKHFEKKRDPACGVVKTDGYGRFYVNCRECKENFSMESFPHHVNIIHGSLLRPKHEPMPSHEKHPQAKRRMPPTKNRRMNNPSAPYNIKPERDGYGRMPSGFENPRRHTRAKPSNNFPCDVRKNCITVL